MIVDKYILFWDGAVARVSQRFGIPTLSRSQLFCLYVVKRSHLPPSATFVIRRARAAGYPVSSRTIYLCLAELVGYGLLSLTDGRYSITPTGREFINAIRRYLLNKRL